jgi:WD40 repeat protein
VSDRPSHPPLAATCFTPSIPLSTAFLASSLALAPHPCFPRPVYPTHCRLDSVATGSAILTMSVCGSYAALGLESGSIVMCSLGKKMRTLFSFSAHPGATTAVSLISPSQLLSGSEEGTVKLWKLDEEDGSQRCTTFREDAHKAPVVCLYGDSDKVVSGGRDGTVRVWDVAAARLRFVLEGFTAYLGSMVCAPTWLLADGTNNAVRCPRLP